LANYGGFDPHVSNDQFLQFGYQPQVENPQVPYTDSSTPQQANYNADVGGGSNQLARRPANPVISRDRGRGDSSQLQWSEQADGQRADNAWGDNLDKLNRRAQLAKKEAQSKRKQIPPFIQKLAR